MAEKAGSSPQFSSFAKKPDLGLFPLEQDQQLMSGTDRADLTSQASDHYGERLAAGARAPARYEAAALPPRGRQFEESECPTRSPFQRDRDRVLHCTAFRRLTHKTQVFVYHEGDHYRTRLTHSLEVAQIARTVARQLRLNEDLAECLSLAHDLGHPPFGHAGERALNEAMADHGGFDHNAQSLRIVTQLEQKYRTFNGLNLTWETLEGLAKHNGPVTQDTSPIEKVVRDLDGLPDLELDHWPSAEAQVAALSDDIAYLTHDIDDGLRAGLLELDDFRDVALLADIVDGMEPGVAGDENRRSYEIARRMITEMIQDVVTESRSRLQTLAPQTANDIRQSREAVIAFSNGAQTRIDDVRAFLFDRVYRSARVLKIVDGAEAIVTDLFTRFLADPQLSDLPRQWQMAGRGLAPRPKARLVADYLAGMTDRYAIAEHRRLFDATPELR
jgi:dGTPase